MCFCGAGSVGCYFKFHCFSARYYGYIRARLSFWAGAGRPFFLKLRDEQNKSYDRCTDVVGDTCFLSCKEYYLQILQRKLATAIHGYWRMQILPACCPGLLHLGGIMEGTSQRAGESRPVRGVFPDGTAYRLRFVRVCLILRRYVYRKYWAGVTRKPMVLT